MSSPSCSSTSSRERSGEPTWRRHHGSPYYLGHVTARPPASRSPTGQDRWPPMRLASPSRSLTPLLRLQIPLCQAVPPGRHVLLQGRAAARPDGNRPPERRRIRALAREAALARAPAARSPPTPRSPRRILFLRIVSQQARPCSNVATRACRGFLSDSVPIMGYRRRSYLVLAGGLGALGCVRIDSHPQDVPPSSVPC